MHLCRCRHGCRRFVGQLHHVDVVAFAAKSLHISSPAELSEIEGCDMALEFPLVIYFNMIEPFGSGLYWLVVYENQWCISRGKVHSYSLVC